MALTTLSRVKAYWAGNLPNADKDSLVQTLIDQVSDAIKRYCDMDFEKQNYAEWHPGARFISLRQFPVNSIWYCGYDTTAASTLRYTGSVRWATVSCNATEITTAVMDTGSPILKRYSTSGKSVQDVCAEVIADTTNPGWTVDNYTSFSNQPAFMVFPFSSWDARVGCRLSVPALPLSVIVTPAHERSIETIVPEGQGTYLFVYYEAGYTLPNDGDSETGEGATDGNLPDALVNLCNRCVVEAYGTSVDYQFSKQHIYDWIVTHAREFVPFRKLSV